MSGNWPIQLSITLYDFTALAGNRDSFQNPTKCRTCPLNVMRLAKLCQYNLKPNLSELCKTRAKLTQNDKMCTYLHGRQIGIVSSCHSKITSRSLRGKINKLLQKS